MPRDHPTPAPDSPARRRAAEVKMVGYITTSSGTAQRLSEKWRHFVVHCLYSLFVHLLVVLAWYPRVSTCIHGASTFPWRIHGASTFPWCIHVYPRASTCIHGKSTLRLVNPRIGISGVFPLATTRPRLLQHELAVQRHQIVVRRTRMRNHRLKLCAHKKLLKKKTGIPTWRASCMSSRKRRSSARTGALSRTRFYEFIEITRRNLEEAVLKATCSCARSTAFAEL